MDIFGPDSLLITLTFSDEFLPGEIGFDIKKALKLLADKFICHYDSIDKEELALVGIIEAQLKNPYSDHNLAYIMNTVMKCIRIPEEYKGKIVEVTKYCTKPELEMLLIINEDMVSDFEKAKATISPKVFAKQHICCGRKRYDDSTQFYRDYYSEDVDKLIYAICEYKRSRGAHQKDELYLADLLKI